MSAATPFLASSGSRFGSNIIDLAPIVLLAIVALAVFDKLGISSAAMGLAAPLIFVSYHSYFNYSWSGETPGRRLFDIRIVSAKGSVDLTSAQCIARPIVKMVWLVSFFPLVFLFHKSWYCLLPALIDVFLVLYHPWRQSVADFICGTIVVRAPPPQPHRAPAAPMYSATDAELGSIPQRSK